MSASTVLDRSKIREEIRVGTLVVPAKRTGEFLGKLRPHLLNVARTRNVVDGAAPGTKQPYKRIIGEILLDKVATVRTVVNKVGDIANEFRTYDLEILAGDPDTKVAPRSRAAAEFGVRNVYWNSRLQAEHGRLLETIPAGSLVADCTCGVGPFSVPLAGGGSNATRTT
ncbi:tRNA (guanine(37)-N(1))-methyltransferase [Aureococcus anophagefferens]|uniref:tRNA (Guanine(37)-N(1))-methyltransferase n=1 Tax=Aureococcus anophagefferens TaxID=44056 RepID=A0ABR1G9M0_AURAN